MHPRPTCAACPGGTPPFPGRRPEPARSPAGPRPAGPSQASGPRTRLGCFTGTAVASTCCHTSAGTPRSARARASSTGRTGPAVSRVGGSGGREAWWGTVDASGGVFSGRGRPAGRPEGGGQHAPPVTVLGQLEDGGLQGRHLGASRRRSARMASSCSRRAARSCPHRREEGLQPGAGAAAARSWSAPVVCAARAGVARAWRQARAWARAAGGARSRTRVRPEAGRAGAKGPPPASWPRRRGGRARARTGPGRSGGTVCRREVFPRDTIRREGTSKVTERRPPLTNSTTMGCLEWPAVPVLLQGTPRSPGARATARAACRAWRPRAGRPRRRSPAGAAPGRAQRG